MNKAFCKGAPVAINSADEYDVAELKKIISDQFNALNITSEFFRGKNVVIKPNLIMKKPPEYAATTAPEILDAVVEIIKKYDCRSILIAESSGGPYTKQSLEAAYSVCGIKRVADKHGIALNYDTSYAELQNPEGMLVKGFNVITPVAQADVIINLPRLKSHALTGMSGAVKNYFGIIPGLQKFELHSRFPDYNDFAKMLVDIAVMLAGRVTTVNILDAIIGMEGNGPTGGTPRKIGCLITSLNPFNIDRIAKELIRSGEVLYLNEAITRGVTHQNISDIEIIGDSYQKFIVSDFKQPDSRPRGIIALLQAFSGGRLNAMFRPNPKITARCVGCGECARSCPQETIKMVKSKAGKNVAQIDLDKCIRCFCCQELCPAKAIDIKKNGFIGLINRAKRRQK